MAREPPATDEGSLLLVVPSMSAELDPALFWFDACRVR